MVMLCCTSELLAFTGRFATEATVRLVVVHALVSMGGAMIFVPLLGLLVRWLTSLDSANHTMGIVLDPRPQFLDDRIMSTPGIALSQVRDEVFRMASVSRSMLADFNALLYRYDSKKVTHVHQQEEVMDLLQRDITDYLARLAPKLSDMQGRYELTRLLHHVNILEQIGDSIATLLAVLGKKKEQRVHFSPAAMNALKMLIAELAEYYDQMLHEWQAPDTTTSSSLHDRRTSVTQLSLDAMETHLERLAEGKCTVRGALLYNDLLEAIERITDCVAKIGDLNTTDGI
jgi:phosphate:Na+ symporter